MVIKPSWPQVNGVVAGCTLRTNGFSEAPFTSLNMGDHVGDNPTAVSKNRALLAQATNFPLSQFQWLDQQHGSHVVLAGQAAKPVADAVISRTPGNVCTILTADCLPILISNQQGTEVAAIHAGWRSLAAGIIGNTIAAMQSAPEALNVWLGPCISQLHFEVGQDVKQAFCDTDQKAQAAFISQGEGKYLACLHTLATLQLDALGVLPQAISRYLGCTYGEQDKFYSYRRDGQTGRMVSFIAIENTAL